MLGEGLMEGYQLASYEGFTLSIALTGDVEEELAQHFDKPRQEDLTFAYWRPSRGTTRYSAVLTELSLPMQNERKLHGNAEFTADYVSRVLDQLPSGAGIAFLHSHPGNGWQAMSRDDEVAERDVLASLVAGATGLPLVGLTWGMERTLSGRFWLRTGRRQYERCWVETVRSVGRRLRMSFHPRLMAAPKTRSTQLATASVWGEKVQSDLARLHVGIVGLGSVGAIVAEALSRTGIQQLTLIDFDVIEDRNLDRTLGACAEDARLQIPKVESSARLISQSHTSETFNVRPVRETLINPVGWRHALDCDVIFSCVDRPLPRHVLNAMAYGHLIPVIDGGILARVSEQGELKHVNWRIQTVGPGRSCLYCQNALLRSDVALDRDGRLDDPDYINGLSHDERERYGRRNVFAFSLSVAAHEILQLAGLVSGNERVGGIGPQSYHGYPGELYAVESELCTKECDINPLTASAMDLERLVPGPPMVQG
jgi:hypothetical protein